MAFDFKKEYKEFYFPNNKPEIVSVPPANYIAVRGSGDPNEEGGVYQKAVGILYAVAYTLKMSYKTDYRIKGFYEYVVPPLEGFWWQDVLKGEFVGCHPCINTTSLKLYTKDIFGPLLAAMKHDMTVVRLTGEE